MVQNTQEFLGEKNVCKGARPEKLCVPSLKLLSEEEQDANIGLRELKCREIPVFSVHTFPVIYRGA